MSRIYKISFDDGTGKKEMFAIKPFLGRFDDFKDEIFIRMPELKNKSLKYYYKDADGDQITIFNTNDFAIFQEQDINKVFVEVQPNNIGPNAGNAREKRMPSVSFGPTPVVTGSIICPIAQPRPPTLKKMPSSSSADEIRRPVHSGVVCDLCDKQIVGIRYKCLECADYDLCMSCEKTNHQHNNHLFIRIANPSDADILIRTKLGKRFGRIRRSESLCSKPDDHHEKKGHEKKSHHKRHGSLRSAPNTLTDIISDVLKAVTGTAEVIDANNGGGGVGGGSAPKKANGQNASTTTTPTNTPAQCPYSHVGGNGQAQLKSHIDTLSNMATHFAQMMDPFSTFVCEPKRSEATTSTNQENDTTSNPSSSEPMEGVNTDDKEKPAEPQTTKQNDVMIIDCSDDDDDEESTLNQRTSREGSSASEAVEITAKPTTEDGSSSPSREWDFVSANEIDDVAQGGVAVRNTGTIPKKPTPPPITNDGNNEPARLDYSELSRRLNDHIATEKLTESVADLSTKPSETSEKELNAAREAAIRMGEFLRVAEKRAPQTQTDGKTDGTTSASAPRPQADPRIVQAVNTMVAMGFSNEGGWLNQLLEAVNGDITSAIELMTPHK